MPGAVSQFLAIQAHQSEARGSRLRRFKQAPAKILPRSFERDFLNGILPLAQLAIDAVNQRIVPRLSEFHRRAVPRADHSQTIPRIILDVETFADEIDDIFGAIQGDLDIIRQTEDVVQGTAAAVNARNAADVRAQIKAVTDADLFFGDDLARDTIQAFVQENVNLVTTIPEGHLARVRNATLRGLNSGQTVEQIAAEIERITRATENQAKLIAEDQVQKLDGALTRVRQVDLGITHYIWRTVGDDRVRPAHRRRNGRRFSWNNPPPDGHPGQPVRCRCNALPDIRGQAATLAGGFPRRRAAGRRAR